MALITCPECNHQVSNYADICVQCGYPIKANKAILTERTSKAIKKQAIVPTIIFVVSFLAMAYSVAFDVYAFNIRYICTAGIILPGIWLWAIKARAWWHHG